MTFKYSEEAKQYANKNGIGDISWIGEGDYGSAYETKCGRVVKVTTDMDEFICAYMLKDKKNPNLVRVDSLEIIDDEKFVIVMEKLDTKGVSLLFKHLMLEADNQNCHFSEIDVDDLMYGLPDEAFSLLDDVMSASKQAKNMGFHANDIHENNIGKRSNGDYVLFDQRTCLGNNQIKEEYNKIKELLLKNKTKVIKKHGISQG